MHLLLDIDGVLQVERPDLESILAREFGWIGDHAAFRQRVFADEQYHDALRGKGDFVDVIGRLLGQQHAAEARRYLQHGWTTDFTLNHELLAALGRLSCERVYLASNQERWRGSAIAAAYAGYPFIAGAYFSYQTGFRKPEPGFFQYVLDDLAVQPADVVFVDDVAENVAAAASLGLRTVRYKTDTQLCDALEQLGCLPGCARSRLP